MKFFVLLSLLSFTTSHALASDLCGMYEEFCPGYFRTPGGSYPSMISSFGSNPSSLPTIPLPLGIELIYNSKGDYSGSSNDFAAIKGMSGLGIGFSMDKNDSFYSYSLKQAFQNTPYTDVINQVSAASTVHSTMNLGAALSLIHKPEFILPVIGTTLIYDEATKHTNLGLGTSISTRIFSAGISYAPSRGKASWGIPETSTTNFNVGIKLAKLNLEYSELYYRTKEASLQTLSLFSNSVRYYTITYDIKKLHFALSRREAVNVLGKKVQLHLISAQWRILSNVGLSYMLNNMPGAHSIGLQIFF